MKTLAPFLLLAANLASATPNYESDITPLLRQYCAGCHNDTDFEGDFSVERFSDFLEGGSKGNPVKPGDPDKTLLMRQLTGQTKKPMPPKDEPQPTPGEIATIRAWLAAGAHGPAEDVSILSTLTVPTLPPSKSAPPITALATSPDHSKLALAWSNSIRIATANPDVPVLEHDALPGKVNAVHFSPDGRRFVAATGIAGLSGTAVVWDLHTGKRIAELGTGTHRDVLYDADFSPDGQTLATAGYDRKIALWDLATGELTRTIDVHNGAVFDLAFSPDGTVLASASADQTVKLWLVATGERLDTLSQPEAEQLAVAFTHDGQHIIAAGADNRIRMWRFVSKTAPAINPLLHARFAHEAPVTGLALSPGGQTLVSTSDDLTLKTWSLPDLILTKTYPGQPDVSSDLAFTGPTTFTTTRLDGSTATFTAPTSSAAPTIASTRNTPATAVPFAPRTFTGTIAEPGQSQLHAFPATTNTPVVLEVNAARSKSPLDSKIEILTADGEPVPQVKLQAVRDSWLTFRGKDSTTADDFRVHNWEDMELDEYLYVNGEVVRLWLYPRGPDSGFKVYPGTGSRRTYFATTALSHPLGQPCAIVTPFPPDVTPPPNGLPVYTLYYENDDDPSRRRGSDSFLIFTPPADGNYQARVTDTRGFAGENFTYTLTVRPPTPDFTAKIEGSKDPAISPGSGKEFTVRVDRTDGFEGPVTVDITGLPPGFSASSPVIVEPGQVFARGTINTTPGAPAPTPENATSTKLTATALIDGRPVTKPIGSFGTLKLAGPAQLTVTITTDGDSGSPKTNADGQIELTIKPGQTITANVVAQRHNFTNRIDFGKEDAVRNIPHGLIIDNIGLNGLMIPPGQTEQKFFIKAAPWVKPTTRQIHLRTSAAGNQTTLPVVLHIVQ